MIAYYLFHASTTSLVNSIEDDLQLIFLPSDEPRCTVEPVRVHVCIICDHPEDRKIENE